MTNALIEQAAARCGEPVILLLPFVLRAQDCVLPGGQPERWTGRQLLWLALAQDTIWLLYDNAQPGLPRIGAAWSALSREGLTIRCTERRSYQDLELSWPDQLRLIVAELHGPADERERLIGLLAADELGIRDLLDRT